MRQTLLAWQMVEHGEFGASGWLHDDRRPRGEHRPTRAGHCRRPSPALDMADAWRSVLKRPAELPGHLAHRANRRHRNNERLATMAGAAVRDMTAGLVRRSGSLEECAPAGTISADFVDPCHAWIEAGAEALEQALARYEEKGNIVIAERLRGTPC